MWDTTSKHVALYKVITILFIITTEIIPHVLSNSLKRKAVPFPAHIENYEDTLIWVIKVTGFNESEKELDTQILFSSHGNRDDLQKFVFESEREHHGKMDTGKESDVIAKKVASDLNLLYLGKVGNFNHLFMVGYNSDPEKFHSKYDYKIHFTELHQVHKRSLDRPMIDKIGQEVEGALDGNDRVVFYSRQRIVSRQKRSLYFSDPYYSRQWHLHNYQTAHMDINVTGVWERNINGTGITVAVVDDGLEWTNEDIHNNYNPSGSWDLNSDDADPMPNGNTASNHHGTRCAGEIAAVPNKVCSVGVAHGAKVSGIRVLDGPMTDSLEADAFTKYVQVNDIYSCSWGPDDDGKTVDGPHILAGAAMQYGINFGRNGYGSIYVVASGNGGRYGDNCNYDGYANSIFTVTIGAVDETGNMPFYAEECASMLAVTFSSGYMKRMIVTTDWTKHGGSGCTINHSGTSAAAPIAAGMIALMLQANKCLTWRDVQYLIVMTAQKVDIDVAHWQKNGAGLYHSHKHGFGLMKAWRLVNAARVWEMVPWITSFYYKSEGLNTVITKSQQKPLHIKYILTEEAIAGYDLFIMEYVQLAVTITHPVRGMLEISLKCPSGTRSLIGATRSHDNSTAGFSDWTFSTVRCWGESPVGVWGITIKDIDTNNYDNGYLKSWKLKIYGTPMTPEQFQQRMRRINEAMSGEFLDNNHTPPCAPPPVIAKPDVPMSQRTLKILALASIFCLVMALYETMEYALCYNDEKKEQKRLMNLNKQARRRMTPRQQETDGDPSESMGLLEMEEIPLDEFPPSNSESSHQYVLESDEHDEETVEFDLGTSYVAAANSRRSNIFSDELKNTDVNSSHSIKSETLDVKLKSSQIQETQNLLNLEISETDYSNNAHLRAFNHHSPQHVVISETDYRNNAQFQDLNNHSLQKVDISEADYGNHARSKDFNHLDRAREDFNSHVYLNAESHNATQSHNSIVSKLPADNLNMSSSSGHFNVSEQNDISSQHQPLLGNRKVKR